MLQKYKRLVLGQFGHGCTGFGGIEFGCPNSIIVVQKNNNMYFKMFLLLILSLTKIEQPLLSADVKIHHSVVTVFINYHKKGGSEHVLIT